MTDLEKFAIDIVSVVRTGQRGTKVDMGTVKRVVEMLEHGPCITLWPRDEAELSQRVRDRLSARKKPMILPRPTVPPTLPREMPPLKIMGLTVPVMPPLPGQPDDVAVIGYPGKPPIVIKGIKS